MIKIYDPRWRGECPLESAELKTFFNKIRHQYPETWGALAFHPRNEGKKSYAQVQLESMEGATPGAVDIMIPARVPFICELKRQNATKSRLTTAERNYLEAADTAGCFCCIAYGWEQAWKALQDWIILIDRG